MTGILNGRVRFDLLFSFFFQISVPGPMGIWQKTKNSIHHLDGLASLSMYLSHNKFNSLFKYLKWFNLDWLTLICRTVKYVVTVWSMEHQHFLSACKVVISPAGLIRVMLNQKFFEKPIAHVPKLLEIN